jgi:phosphoribosylformylglycinamidine (FGAM) synthase-like amidotransferase family enzyme
MTTGRDRILVQNRIDFVTGAVRRYVADVDALTALAQRVQELFAGRNVDDLLREPAEGEWSALRTLGHMTANARVLHDQLDRMAARGQIAFRYCEPDGAITEAANPNGAARNVAGVFNDAKTVLGMMPHPERLADPALGGIDGRPLFDGLVEALS